MLDAEPELERAARPESRVDDALGGRQLEGETGFSVSRELEGVLRERYGGLDDGFDRGRRGRGLEITTELEVDAVGAAAKFRARRDLRARFPETSSSDDAQCVRVERVRRRS